LILGVGKSEVLEAFEHIGVSECGSVFRLEIARSQGFGNEGGLDDSEGDQRLSDINVYYSINLYLKVPNHAGNGKCLRSGHRSDGPEGRQLGEL
jgi:hypothetical protein